MFNKSKLFRNGSISRREMLLGTATAALGVGAASLVGCNTGDQTSTEPVASEEGTSTESVLFKPTKEEWGLPVFAETPDEEIETEILVVGSGMGGLSAAVTAAEAGYNVLVIEKTAVVGGNSNFAEGIFACESPLQEELGIKAAVDDMLQTELEFQHYIVDSQLWNTVINNSPEDIRWLMDQGVSFSQVAGAEYGQNTTHHIYAGEGLGSNAIAALKDKAESLGVEIRLSNRATHLLKDGEAVVGAQVDANGMIVNIKSNVVILATGGVGGNWDICNNYTNRSDENFVWMGAEGVTGDGMMMAVEVGMAERPYRIGGCGATPTLNGCFFQSQLSVAAAMEAPNIWVNHDGKRFAREDLIQTYVYVLNAMDSQTKVYSVFDQDQFDRLVNEGCNRGWGFYIAAGEKLTNLPEELEKQIELGNSDVFVADTIEELADSMGLDPIVLQETVDTYNTYVEAGSDPDYRKDAAWLRAIGTPPFYGFHISLGVIMWSGGIHVNPQAEVIKQDGTVIPGLYAAGLDCGGFQGETYGLTLAGSNQAIALGMGKQCVRSAIEYIRA